MKRQSLVRLIFGLMGLTLLILLGISEPVDAMPICGPGSHWVDTCGSGTDTFPSVATIGLDLNLDDIKDISVVLSGPTSIFRGNPVDAIISHPILGNVGTADGHLDVIQTEIVSLNLTGGGFTVVAGDGIGNLSNDRPLYSPGAIVEQTGDPYWADSFFDVFFEIQTPFGPLYNKDTFRLGSTIDRVPPIGFDYVHLIPAPISLFDINNIERARLVNAVHTVPEPSTLLLLGSGLAGIIGLGRKRLFKKA